MKEQHELDLQMPANMSDVFHFADGQSNFNDLAHIDNGFDYWYASDVMNMLGYGSYESNSKPIQRAIAACTTLQIDITDNFKEEKRSCDGRDIRDFKLSRFGSCDDECRSKKTTGRARASILRCCSRIISPLR